MESGDNSRLVRVPELVAIELSMPRAQYPREYPPWFVFALSAFYVGALAWEWRQTLLAARTALR